MKGETIRGRIAEELAQAMLRLGGDPTKVTYESFAEAGATPELLSIVGSFGDTLSDEEVLVFLQDYNAGRPVVREGYALETAPDKLDS